MKHTSKVVLITPLISRLFWVFKPNKTRLNHKDGGKKQDFKNKKELQ
jgi:hypothetical protein